MFPGIKLYMYEVYVSPSTHKDSLLFEIYIYLDRLSLTGEIQCIERGSTTQITSWHGEMISVRCDVEVLE